MYARMAIYAGAVLAFLALCAGLISYGYYRKGLEVDAAIVQQSIKSNTTVVKQEENKAKEVVKYIKVKGKTEVVNQIVEKKVIEYVYLNDQRCVLSNELVREFDDVSRMFEPTTDGVPAARDTTGDSVGRDTTDVSCAQVLQAYKHAAQGWRELWDKYEPLRAWEQSNYTIARDGSGHAPLIEGALE